MSFSNDIEKFANDVQTRFTIIKRRACLGLFSAIVMQTPVDKGVLRNNWQMQLNTAADGTFSDGDRSGQTVLSRVRVALDGVNPVNAVYFTNNLPYAARIEYEGWSGKAPNGMVRVNTARWQTIVSAAARGVR